MTAASSHTDSCKTTHAATDDAGSAMRSRVEADVQRNLLSLRMHVDRMFALLMVLQWVGVVVAAAVISPTTWIGEAGYLHPHFYMALIGGALLAAGPLALMWCAPGLPATRIVIAVAQCCFSSMLIHLTGGRIETHFHIFGSLAFLAAYLDWRVLAAATVTVATDHFARGLFWPESVFGTASASNWRWLEHAGWVIFEDIFLLSLCSHTLRRMRMASIDRERVNNQRSMIESQVQRRTAQLQVARAAAEAATRAKTEFLANMSHEIRTPMTAILGYADLMDDPNQNIASRTDCLATIRRNGEHLLTIINDILDVSKIEAGMMTVERVPFSPLQIVEEVVSLMRVRATAKELSLDVEHLFPLPSQVMGDPLRVRQVLVNLVGNALKFTHQGGVRVLVALRSGAQGEQTLRFSIIDTGEGMSPETVRRLFQPFTQADTSITRRHGGSGLGLVISRRLVTMLGGEMDVRSKIGVGSEFTFSIPATPAPGSRSLHGIEDLNRSPRHAAARERSLEKVYASVLLVEDGPDNMRLVSHLLRMVGAEVVTAENGLLGIQAIHARTANNQAPFDVVFMDMQMPVMDGYAAARTLRAEGYTGRIVALTAHAMAEDAKRCKDAGCDDFLTKPVDRRRLIDCLRMHVHQARAQRPAPAA